MGKLTLLLFTGIAMNSIAYGQNSVRLNSTAAAASPTAALQLSTTQVSAQRQADPVSTLSVFPNFGWTNKPALPGGIWGTGPAFSKNCIAGTDTGMIYLIAGYDASFANTNATTIYNTTTGLYRSGAVIPAVRGQVTPVKVRNKIYVIGGYGATSFSPVTTNSIYTIATNTWSTGTAMPIAVGDYACGVYKDSLIYYVGGYNGSADVNNVQIYNTSTNSWTVGTAVIGTAVAGCRMGISGNNIVFVGGYSQTLAAEVANAYSGAINPANPNLITWSALPNYPGGTVGRLAGGVSFENDGRIYFGGGDPDGQGISVLNSIYAYNTTTSAWDSGPNMPVAVSNICSLTGIVNNDSLYLVTMGGYNGSIITTTHSWLNLGPAAPLPVGPASVSICAGFSTTLTAMNALTYSWSPATNLSSTTTSSTVANPASTITYSVTMTKAYGCPVVTPVTVTVNPLPTVTANSTLPVVCAGDIEVLTGGGASTYTWDNGVGNGVPFGPVSTLTYMVTGTDVNGCMNTATITIVVNPVPVTTTTSTNASCNGSLDGTAMTTVSGTSTYSYSWSNSGTTSMISGIGAGTYSVTVTDNMTGCSTLDMTTVGEPTAITEIVLNDTTWLCNGTLTANVSGGTGAYTYQWTPGGQTTQTATGLCAGTYTCTVIDGNGCTATVTADVVTNLGIAQTVSTSGISIYPNPANGSVILTGNFSNEGKVSINLVNLLGENVMAIENNAVIGVYSKTIDLSTISSGVYYLRVIQNGAVISNEKVVKQ